VFLLVAGSRPFNMVPVDSTTVTEGCLLQLGFSPCPIYLDHHRYMFVHGGLSLRHTAHPCLLLAPAAPSPPGDKIIADGLVLESHGLVIDEASLTGESDPIKKNEEDPWCRSGTQVHSVRMTGPQTS
jgi:hypothetical protein